MFHRPRRTCWDPNIAVARSPRAPVPELHGPTLAEIVAANKLSRPLSAEAVISEVTSQEDVESQGYIDNETGEIFACSVAPAVKN